MIHTLRLPSPFTAAADPAVFLCCLQTWSPLSVSSCQWLPEKLLPWYLFVSWPCSTCGQQGAAEMTMSQCEASSHKKLAASSSSGGDTQERTRREGEGPALPTESPTATHLLREPAKPSLACRIWSKWNGCWFQPLSFEVFVVQWVITETVIFCSSVCVCFLIDIFSCECENLASVTVTVYNFLSQVNRDNY